MFKKNIKELYQLKYLFNKDILKYDKKCITVI